MKRPPKSEGRWLLLLLQLPRKAGYLRVKIWRRLQRLGAVPVKYGVYAMPRSEERNEDLQWVLREIAAGGGEAMLVEAGFVHGMSDAEVEQLFHRARDVDYEELAVAIRALQRRVGRRKLAAAARAALEPELRKLERAYDEIARIDFFSSSGREATRALLDSVAARLRPSDGAAARPPAKPDEHRARTWVTRQGIFVDRIGSAWLIRRFIDPEARFKFVVGKGYLPEPGELRFDMFEAEFTHVGDRCTFEVLVDRFGLDDPGLRAIAEIVHDIDVKDDKFGRAEAAGIEKLLAAVALRARNDLERLDRGGAIFDDLYELFRRRKGQEAT